MMHLQAGSLTSHGDGYMRRIVHGHPRADAHGRVLEHVLIAENALGKPLPEKAVVHHHDEDGTNNANTNLVICEDQAYHVFIHARLRVLRAHGDPDSDKICSTCQTVRIKHLFTKNASCWDGLHAECRFCKYPREAERKRRRRAEKREAIPA